MSRASDACCLLSSGPDGSAANIGLEWQSFGVGDFSGNANETDMIMRNTSTGVFEFYDIQHNQIVAAGSLGGVGTEWHNLGVGTPQVLGAGLV